MNKKITTSFVVLMAMMFSFSLVLADNTSADMTVRVNFRSSSIGISVPSLITFDNIASGYLSERQDLDIVNTGTVDVEITPELDSSYDGDIFTNLVFQNVLADPMTDIGVFDFTIEKPTIAGETRTENIYMYLDLTEYSGNTSSNVDNHETDIVFWAVAP
jgi:hypothetical protein